MDNLFKSDLTGAEWTTFCGGNTGGDKDGDEETCLELAEVDGGYAIRNNQAKGSVTFATAAELATFAVGLKERGIVA